VPDESPALARAGGRPSDLANALRGTAALLGMLAAGAPLVVTCHSRTNVADLLMAWPTSLPATGGRTTPARATSGRLPSTNGGARQNGRPKREQRWGSFPMSEGPDSVRRVIGDRATR
jgi:hypothetical protein